MKTPKYLKFQHTGIVADYEPEEVVGESWTDCGNMSFIDGVTTSEEFYSTFVTAGAAPLFTMSITIEGEPFWIYCTSNEIYVTDGATLTNLTPTGGLTAVSGGDWNGSVLGGIPVLNNGVNPPMYWNLNPVTNFGTLTGWPASATCKVIRCFKYHLFALNVTIGTVNYPSTIWWSNAAADGTIPTQWTPKTTNDAGDVSLSDTTGIIVDALPMRDTLIVYKDNATYIVSYVAGNYVFNQRKAFITTGVLSPNCVLEIDGYHWAFTGKDLIKHDGQSYTSMLTGKVKNVLENAINNSKSEMVQLVHRQQYNQVWVCIPEIGSNYLSLAYIVNTKDGTIGKRVLDNVSFIGKGLYAGGVPSDTWDLDTGTWDTDNSNWNNNIVSALADTLLMCRPTELSYVVSDMCIPDSFVERLSLSLVQEEEDRFNPMEVQERKFITRLIPRIKANTGTVINISVGGQSCFGESISWSQPYPFVVGVDQCVPTSVEGRYISIRFENSGSECWQIYSYMLEYVKQGLW